jgi:hypothetical protein
VIKQKIMVQQGIKVKGHSIFIFPHLAMHTHKKKILHLSRRRVHKAIIN